MEQRRFWHGVQDAAIALFLVVAGTAEAFGFVDSAIGNGSPIVSTVGIAIAACLLSQRPRRAGQALGADLGAGGEL